MRAAVVTALKYTIFEKSLPVDKVLKEHITAFLDLITDKEIEVRKATLISLNFIAHHKAKIVRYFVVTLDIIKDSTLIIVARHYQNIWDTCMEKLKSNLNLSLRLFWVLSNIKYTHFKSS